MQVGKRLLTVLVLIGLAACGEPGTPVGEAAQPESASNSLATTAPVETTATDAGQDPSLTTLATQGGTTSTLAEPPVSTTTSGIPGQFDPALQPYVDQAMVDLAGRLEGDPSSITVVSAEIVVWPDAGLGCPQPGMVYTQVPVDGSLIKLSAGGIEYRYHTGGRVGTPFLCEN